MRRASSRLSPWIVVLALALPGTAQEAPRPKDPPEVAVERWLASDQTDQKLLDRTVDAVLAEPRSGLAWLGRQLAKDTAPRAPRGRGLAALATHVSLQFVERQRKTELVFAGQYAPLDPLQPYVGRLFLLLLLETPDWFPDTHRIRLVAPLRDLFPQSPEADAIEGMVEIVRNVETEPPDLREALSCALYQWGRREFVQPLLERWRKASAEGDAVDRIDALRKLAGLQYQLRDYAAAAGAHVAMQTLAEAGGERLWPSDWYQAACLHSLLGERDQAFAALDRCAALLAAADVDPSVKLARRLFEEDPELSPLRADRRFAAFLAKAFGPAPGAPDRRGPGR